MSLNKDILKGRWGQMSGAIREEWSKLTDDDLQHISGKYNKLVGKLQEHYGYTKEEAERHLENFIHDLGSKTKETVQSIESNIRRFGSHVNETVTHSPWTIAAITSLAGFAIGLLINAKFRP